jgi:hypothetical protein
LTNCPEYGIKLLNLNQLKTIDKGDFIMTTFNIASTVPAGKLHKRQSGLWGQLLASAEIEAKLSRVEPLFRELHGKNMSRTAFFTKCRELSREGKSDVGGYLQYMTQDMAGILLREMHTRIGKEVRRNRTVKNEVLKRTNVVFEVGGYTFDTADFVKGATGLPMVDGFTAIDSKLKKLYQAMLNRNYPVTKATLMKEAGIKTEGHFNNSIVLLRKKGFTIEAINGKHKSIATKYQLAV